MARSGNVQPVNYGVEDGLRSAQCAPGYPIERRGNQKQRWTPVVSHQPRLGGARSQRSSASRRGARWFICWKSPWTAVRYPGADGAELAPGKDRMQFRYTGIHLSAPERVRYSYRLEGLDGEWVRSVARRVTNYNSLPHGQYRFTVRAERSQRAIGRNLVRFRITSALLRDSLVPLSLCRLGRRGHLGFIQLAAAPDSPAILAGAGGARRARPRNSRHPGTRLRRHFFAAGCRGAHPQQPRGRWLASIWIWRARWCVTA